MLTRALLSWLILGALLLSVACKADEHNSSAAQNKRGLIFDINVLEDPSTSLTFAAIQKAEHQQRFRPTQPHKNIGYSTSAWWLQIKIPPQTASQWFLQLDSVCETQVDALRLVTAQHTPTGSLFKLGGCPQHTYLLELPRQETSFLYVRLEGSYSQIHWSISFKPKNTHPIQYQFNLIIIGFIVGGLLSLSAYNLFLLFSFRDRSYFALFFYTLSLAILAAANYSPFYSLFNSYDSYMRIRIILPLLAMATGLAFYRKLIRLPLYQPRLDILLRVIIFSNYFIILLSFWITIDSKVSAMISAITLPLVLGSTLFASLGLNDRSARAFLSSITVLTLTTVPVILIHFGLLDISIPVLQIMHIGFLIFALLLSFTQVDHTRELREASERTQAANRAKTEFLTTLSHELRTPMNAVIGLGELLQKTQLNRTQRNYIGKLNVAAAHMLRLIDDILDLARIEKNELTLEQEPFQLTQALDTIMDILQTQAAQKKITLKLQCEFTADYWVIGDLTRLSQVLLNLAYNAIKCTEQGHVTLSVSAEEQITAQNESPPLLTLAFAVTDTGMGMDEEQIEQLFQPFVRPKHGQEGNGLGLIIVRQLLQAMGSQLQVESQIGKGSCFYFRLNLPWHANRPTPHPAHPATCSTTWQKPLHVLLVEDDEINGFVTRSFLEGRHIHISLATSGREALDKLLHQTAEPVDLILMDIRLPDQNGYEVATAIRAAGYTQVPIIALTAHAVSGEQERCLAVGMNDFVTKPVKLQELETLIQHWTQR